MVRPSLAYYFQKFDVRPSVYGVNKSNIFSTSLGCAFLDDWSLGWLTLSYGRLIFQSLIGSLLISSLKWPLDNNNYILHL